VAGRTTAPPGSDPGGNSGNRAAGIQRYRRRRHPGRGSGRRRDQFFNGFGGVVYGPEGNGLPGTSQLGSFGGISSYIGTEGALVGLFLNDDIPNGAAPAALNFSTVGVDPLGIDFLTLMPGLGQVFFIGNGVTSGGDFQEFIAPAGATRFFLGVPDGFGFNGAPGAYDDNDGSYRVRLGINEIPTIPEPATAALLLCAAVAGLAASRRRSKRAW